jgi:TM2 domain-containing membrane protein YozV
MKSNKYVLAAVAYFFGWLGVDQFLVGNKKGGLTTLLTTILLWWLLFIPVIVNLIRGGLRAGKYLSEVENKNKFVTLGLALLLGQLGLDQYYVGNEKGGKVTLLTSCLLPIPAYFINIIRAILRVVVYVVELLENTKIAKNKIVAAVLALLFGWLGLDQFFMGDEKGGKKTFWTTILLWWLLFIPVCVNVIRAIIRIVKYFKK